MKLLGWMHRKFRRNSSEPQKDYAIGKISSTAVSSEQGKSSLDDHHYILKPNFKPYKEARRDEYLRKSFAGLEAGRVEEEYENDTSYLITEIFHGFLAIGTLGSAEVGSETMTPKFSLSLDNIAEKENEVSENELKFINIELGKVLAAESKEDECNGSSHRNSQVSMGRSSHASTITLSGKPTDTVESTLNGTLVCPLQEYLFGTATEAPEKKTEVKEIRTSLGDLFKKCKLTEEDSGAQCNKEEKRAQKEVDKSALYVMIKKLKKKMLHTASKNSEADAMETPDSALAEKKLQKILHMFNRKVHPDNPINTERLDNPQKTQNKNKVRNDESYDLRDRTLENEDIVSLPQKVILKHRLQCYKMQTNPLHFTSSSSDTNGNKEQWIRTDADYVVLEL